MNCFEFQAFCGLPPNLLLDHIRLDEMWGNVKRSVAEVWVWAATEAKTKIIPVLQLGERSQAMAYSSCMNSNPDLQMA